MTRSRSEDFIDLLEDGAASSMATGDGRMIPILLVDSEKRKDIKDVINFHQGQPSGDVMSTWGKSRFGSRFIYLILEFIRPTVGKAIIEFDLEQHIMVVDGLIRSNAAYLQSNSNGNKISDNLDQPKLILEIPCAGAPFNWDKIFRKMLKRNLIKMGTPSRDIDAAIKSVIEMHKAFWIASRKNH